MNIPKKLNGGVWGDGGGVGEVVVGWWGGWWGVHSWIIVCTYSSQGSDMLEVLSASIEAAMQVRTT